jgi:hypothetical protein
MQWGKGLRRIAYVLIAAFWVFCLSFDHSQETLVWLLEVTAACAVLIGVATWVARGFRTTPQSSAHR